MAGDALTSLLGGRVGSMGDKHVKRPAALMRSKYAKVYCVLCVHGQRHVGCYTVSQSLIRDVCVWGIGEHL